MSDYSRGGGEAPQFPHCGSLEQAARPFPEFGEAGFALYFYDLT